MQLYGREIAGYLEFFQQSPKIASFLIIFHIVVGVDVTKPNLKNIPDLSVNHAFSSE